MSKWQEDIKSIFVPKEFLEVHLVDVRTWLAFGDLAGLCKQHSIQVSMGKRFAKLSAPRDRLQLCLEAVHFSRVPYHIGRKEPREIRGYGRRRQ